MSSNHLHAGVRPLRSQLIVPLIGTIALVAIVIAILSWLTVSSRATANIHRRLDTVCDQCDRASFPMTLSVLKQIRMFSGVDVALMRNDSTSSIYSDERMAKWNLAELVNLKKDGLQTIRVGDEQIDVLVRHPLRSPYLSGYDTMIAAIDTSERSNVAWQAFWLPIVTALGAAIATFIVAAVVTSQMARRIETLDAQVNKIASGDYKPLHVIGPSDAISRLMQSVNKMTEELGMAHEKIAASERARLINLIASGMAHQLRNSLGGAILLLQTIQRSHSDLEEVPMALNQLKLAHESIQRLLTAKLGLDASNYRSMSVLEIQQSLQDYLGAHATHHHVELAFESTTDQNEVVLKDGEAILGALLNLIINAIEATGRGGCVNCTVTCSEVSNRSRSAEMTKQHGFEWTWIISDNGPGPSLEVADQILEAFVTTKQEGVGLGLPMAKRVAQQMGGDLMWYREDGWTKFHFRVIRNLHDTTIESLKKESV